MKKYFKALGFLFVLLGAFIAPKISFAEVCTSWTLSEWTECISRGEVGIPLAGTQTRSVTSTSPDDCSLYQGTITDEMWRECKYLPPCTSSDYICSDWSDCLQTGVQKRNCYLDKKENQWPWSGNFECEGGVSMPETFKSCSYIQPQIISITPLEGAVGDDVKILLPHIYDVFPDCSWTWIYATHDLSAKVYFNNVETVLKYPINDNALGEGGQPIYVTVPPGASTGKIKVELMCKSKGGYGDYDYNTTMVSDSNFTILSPAAQDDLSVRQQYLQQTKVDQAWDYSHGSSDIIVAVIDDGIYMGHPDLDNNIWINNAEIEGNNKDDDGNGYVDDRWGWDFVSDSQDMTTLGTHGTMVAGIIGSESNNSTGITGINWNVRLMSIIACDEEGCSDDAIKKGIKYAVDNGADIINLSLGGDVFNYTDSYNEIIKYAFDKNVLIVIATGNGDLEGGIGRNLNVSKVSPVCNDGNQNMILGVGAVDAENKLTSWSNYGNCADVYAPGENIVSTAVPAYSSLNGFYDMADGTSFSTPIVSGIAALIKAKYPTIKNTAIRDRIINNSDYQNGIRVVNAYKAISMSFSDSEKFIAPTSNTVIPVPPSNNLETKDVETVNQSSKVIEEEKKLVTKVDQSLSSRMNGRILLQVEQNGEGWYVNPQDSKKYYLGRPADAFSIMRKLGLGISEKDYYTFGSYAPSRLVGKILIRAEASGEAYYVNPKDNKMYYLGRPADAFKVMRELGLGITNTDIRKIDVGSIN